MPGNFIAEQDGADAQIGTVNVYLQMTATTDGGSARTTGNTSAHIGPQRVTKC